MITIGILGLDHEDTIVTMLRRLFRKSTYKFAIVESYDAHLFSQKGFKLKSCITELEKNETQIAIIKVVPEKVLEGMYTGIQFDLMLSNSIGEQEAFDSERLSSAYSSIFMKMENKKVAIINADDPLSLAAVKGSKMYVITCGLSSKATITASSIEDGTDTSRFILCLQRGILTLEGACIEPQEFVVTVSLPNSKDIYSTLAAVSAAMVCGVDMAMIQGLSL